jgi:hypothetical protein
MAYTLAHPAAVLPLRRFRSLPFLPLLVGSIAPDTPFYVPRALSHAFPNSHTLEGSILVSLPAGLLVLWLLIALRAPLTTLLWEPHRTLACAGLEEFLRQPRRWLYAVPALLIGIWLHIVWDSFTHYDGWVVEHVALLRVPLPIFGRQAAVYHLLQYASSVAGLLILFTWYRARVRRARARLHPTLERDWRPFAFATMLIHAAASGMLSAWQSPPADRASFYTMASVTLTMGSAVLAVEILTIGTLVAVNAIAQRREAQAHGARS